MTCGRNRGVYWSAAACVTLSLSVVVYLLCSCAQTLLAEPNAFVRRVYDNVFAKHGDTELIEVCVACWGVLWCRRLSRRLSVSLAV